MTKRWRWLESTRDLQRDAFGLDPDRDRNWPERQANRVKENFIAAIVEMVELLNEVKWKYWSHEEPWVRREKVLQEAVDVAHFLANILVAIQVTDEEWEKAYQAKQQENRDRQARKYIAKQHRGES